LAIVSRLVGKHGQLKRPSDFDNHMINQRPTPALLQMIDFDGALPGRVGVRDQ
jgi:hypothetical protein